MHPHPKAQIENVNFEKGVFFAEGEGGGGVDWGEF